MKLENTMRIPVPVPEAWAVLLDIERIAPCVPGAALTGRDGDRYDGKVKVKLGPIGLTYNGSVAFVSRDEAARVVVMEATGREIRGGGTATATITCRLAGSAGATDVSVETELAITGKPAQFGRGALNEVATVMLGQFASNLAAELAPAVPDPAPEAVAEPIAEPAAEPVAEPAAEPVAESIAEPAAAPAVPQPRDPVAPPIDVLAAGPVAFRVAVPAAALLLAALVAGLAVRIVRRRRPD